MDRDEIVKVLAVGGAGFAAYQLVYKPWAIRKALQAQTEAAILANRAQGMGLEEASQKALAGVCIGAAAYYKIPPSTSAGICQGVGVLAVKGVQLAERGAVIGGKVVGHLVKGGVMGGGSLIKSGVMGGGSLIKSGVMGTGGLVKGGVMGGGHLIKGGALGGAKAVKFLSYTAPVAVATTVAKTAAKGAAAVIKSVSHGFGLWGLPPAPRNPFADHARRRAGGDLSPGRRRRSLGGLPGPAPARGRAFYTRHL